MKDKELLYGVLCAVIVFVSSNHGAPVLGAKQKSVHHQTNDRVGRNRRKREIRVSKNSYE